MKIRTFGTCVLIAVLLQISDAREARGQGWQGWQFFTIWPYPLQNSHEERVRGKNIPGGCQFNHTVRVSVKEVLARPRRGSVEGRVVALNVRTCETLWEVGTPPEGATTQTTPLRKEPPHSFPPALSPSPPAVLPQHSAPPPYDLWEGIVSALAQSYDYLGLKLHHIKTVGDVAIYSDLYGPTGAECFWSPIYYWSEYWWNIVTGWRKRESNTVLQVDGPPEIPGCTGLPIHIGGYVHYLNRVFPGCAPTHYWYDRNWIHIWNTGAGAGTGSWAASVDWRISSPCGGFSTTLSFTWQHH